MIGANFVVNVNMPVALFLINNIAFSCTIISTMFLSLVFSKLDKNNLPSFFLEVLY